MKLIRTSMLMGVNIRFQLIGKSQESLMKTHDTVLENLETR
jgi:hypothetical protein